MKPNISKPSWFYFYDLPSYFNEKIQIFYRNELWTYSLLCREAYFLHKVPLWVIYTGTFRFVASTGVKSKQMESWNFGKFWVTECFLSFYSYLFWIRMIVLWKCQIFGRLLHFSLLQMENTSFWFRHKAGSIDDETGISFSMKTLLKCLFDNIVWNNNEENCNFRGKINQKPCVFGYLIDLLFFSTFTITPAGATKRKVPV